MLAIQQLHLITCRELVLQNTWLTFTENKNEITINYSVDSVSYCQDRAISEFLANCFLDNCISRGVN